MWGRLGCCCLWRTGLCLIEKVAFQEPYRLVKLQNRAELRDYLMAKYDTSWGQDTTRPFIMENDNLMAE